MSGIISSPSETGAAVLREYLKSLKKFEGNPLMADERRRSPRVNVNLPVRWEGVLTQKSATVSSLSNNGCFILSGGKVESKELIRLEIRLPEGEPIYFWSEVVDEAYDIGFAARFTMASDEDKERLASFMTEELARNPTS